MRAIRRVIRECFNFIWKQRFLVRPLSKVVRSIFYHLLGYRVIHSVFKGLQFGSGGNRIEGFYNLDADPHSDCDITCNVVRLKINSNCVQVIYNSHILEHIPHKKARCVLQEWYRVLKPGGKLYISVPDCEVLFNIYLNNLASYDENTRRIVDLACNIVYGGGATRYDYHHSGYSFRTLKALLESVGFKGIERFDRKTLAFTTSFTDAALTAEIQGIPISLNIEATK